MALDFDALLYASGALQRATDLRGLLQAVKAAVQRSTRYRTVWLGAWEDTPDGEYVRILDAQGAAEELIYEKSPRFPTGSDAMLLEIKAGQKPVVVVDARTDPRTDKAMVAKLGHRTIINVPLLLGGTTIGALGSGSFGDEGCLAPTADELEMLTLLALQVAPALDRVRLMEREKASEVEREALRQRLHRMERMETLALLAGGVAHDFNNLLTIIINSLHFLAGNELNAQAQEDVKDATEAADRARQVTQQLLALGRRQALKPIPVDWASRLEELLRLLRRVMPETVELSLETAPDLPPVLADGSQLDQVVMNLALNARDAMPQGGRLRLTLGPAVLDSRAAAPVKVRAGPAVCLTVTDTGHGMTPAVLEHIFEPFFTTKGAGVGTGLGLAIALGVVEQHGGLLECQSVPGQGTTFKVTLPVAPAATRTLEQRLTPAATQGHERILAAEDDASIRELLERILTDGGYQATVVADGEAAVEAARREPFDLVLLDAVMPRKTGREAFEEIRVLRPGAAWLFMTGYAADTLPPDLLTAHGVEVLEKPWRPAELLAAVRRALEGAAARRT